MRLLSLTMIWLPTTQKIANIRSIIYQMTDNARFPWPTPPLGTIATATNTLEAAVKKANRGSLEDIVHLYESNEIVDRLILKLAKYVESVAKANRPNVSQVIRSSGFEVYGKLKHRVRTLQVIPTGNIGELMLKCTGSINVIYEFQISTDITNEANWRTISTGTRGRIIKDGFTLDTRLYFRVRTIGKGGVSEWSEIRSVLLKK